MVLDKPFLQLSHFLHCFSRGVPSEMAQLQLSTLGL